MGLSGMGGIIRISCIDFRFEPDSKTGSKKMESTVLRIEDFCAYFGDHCVLNNVNLSITRNKVTAVMGPSGCGKTTLIRCVNRMHELVPGATTSGKMLLLRYLCDKPDHCAKKNRHGFPETEPVPYNEYLR